MTAAAEGNVAAGGGLFLAIGIHIGKGTHDLVRAVFAGFDF